MITLLTGGPGMGKTALAVDLLLTEYKDRPIWTNIKGLTLDHEVLPPYGEWVREETNPQGTTEWKFNFPPGSIVVIDECQQFFRVRPTGAKVPPQVQAFETHRHEGIDFILLTQGSGLIDSNLRKLVKGGRHIFLRSSFIGRYRHEKSEQFDEEDKYAVNLTSKRKYKLPKHVFELYQSSKKHTKPARPRLPMQAYALVALVLIGGGLIWRATDRVQEKTQPQAISAMAGEPRPAQPGGSRLPGLTAVPDRIIEAMLPVDDHNHLSAPLYAHVAPPVVAPEIVGCVASSRACSCYSQQTTPVWVPDEQCRQRSAGLYYDPYRQPMQREQAGTMPRTGVEESVSASETLSLPAS